MSARPPQRTRAFGEGKPMSLRIVLVFFVLAASACRSRSRSASSRWAPRRQRHRLNMLPQRMMHAVNSFPLMSIPFFMLAGELMIKAGMMERLIDLANAWSAACAGGWRTSRCSRRPGSLPCPARPWPTPARWQHAGAVAAQGVRAGFAAAVVAAAANLGPIIPPSGAMIVYAFMAGPSVSVAGLFMAGVVPGIIMAFGMMGMCSYFAHRRNYPLTGEAFRFASVWHELRRSLDHLPDAGGGHRRDRRRGLHGDRRRGDRRRLCARDRLLRHPHADA